MSCGLFVVFVSVASAGAAKVDETAIDARLSAIASRLQALGPKQSQKTAAASGAIGASFDTKRVAKSEETYFTGECTACPARYYQACGDGYRIKGERACGFAGCEMECVKEEDAICTEGDFCTSDYDCGYQGDCDIGNNPIGNCNCPGYNPLANWPGIERLDANLAPLRGDRSG